MIHVLYKVVFIILVFYLYILLKKILETLLCVSSKDCDRFELFFFTFFKSNCFTTILSYVYTTYVCNHMFTIVSMSVLY